MSERKKTRLTKDEAAELLSEFALLLELKGENPFRIRALNNGARVVEALWARYCLGEREDGSAIEPNDPIWDDLTARARAAQYDPETWLELTSVYDEAVAGNAGFRTAFTRHLRCIQTEGVSGAIQVYLDAGA